MCVRLNEGITGKVILDEFADREPDYWITDMAPNGSFIKIAEVINIDLKTRVSSSNRPTAKFTKNEHVLRFGWKINSCMDMSAGYARIDE